MPYTIYDHVNAKGVNTFREWTEGLQRPDRVKLAVKLDALAMTGSDLAPGLFADSNSKHIKKLRIIGRGSVQLRPMLCKGPIDNNSEFTLLLGAIEKGSRLEPKNADALAERLRQEVAANPNKRRCKHEPVT